MDLCERPKTSMIKTGDLIWYNTAGSKEIALVLDMTITSLCDRIDPTVVALIQWAGNTGGIRPRMYDKSGRQIYSSRESRRQFDRGWVPLKTKEGYSLFKVINESG